MAGEADYREHVRARTKTYRIWAGIMTRVRNKKHERSKPYRDRNIGCDPRWYAFSEFFADMGPCPEGKSIDRTDNALGYSRENCRWATQAEQSRNTSRNVWVVLDGQPLVFKDALAKVGYSFQAYYFQRRLHGTTPQEAIDKYRLKPKAPGEWPIAT